MFKVYVADELIGSFDDPYDAALLSTNETISRPLGTSVEVWSTIKTNFIHFNVGVKPGIIIRKIK